MSPSGHQKKQMVYREIGLEYSTTLVIQVAILVAIDSVSRLDHSLYEGLNASPKLDGFDMNAKLEHVHYQGSEYTVSSKGVVKTS